MQAGNIWSGVLVVKAILVAEYLVWRFYKLLAGLLDPATSECDVFFYIFVLRFFFTNCWQVSWIWRRQNEMCDSVKV